MKKGTKIAIQQKPYRDVHQLYDKYAGMLLGYLFEIVKDIQLAEQYLVNIYQTLPKHMHELQTDNCSTWCHLQRIAKRHLSGYFDAVREDGALSQDELSAFYARNKYIALMSPEQQQVFCNVYYRGKTTAELSLQLNKTEDTVRKALKEAFTILKQRK